MVKHLFLRRHLTEFDGSFALMSLSGREFEVSSLTSRFLPVDINPKICLVTDIASKGKPQIVYLVSPYSITQTLIRFEYQRSVNDDFECSFKITEYLSFFRRV